MLQVVFGGAGKGAEGAGVRLFAGVDSQVPVQLVGIGKALAAVIALVRLRPFPAWLEWEC